MPTRKSIEFSAVIAAYNIEDYARALFRSLDAQSIDHEKIEIVFVDDGSSDNTFELAQRWQRTTKLSVHLISKENGGVATARNAGIEKATGDWIAFVDSDDVLHRDYFKSLEDFVLRDTSASASMLTSRSLIFNESLGIVQDSHPLGWKYRYGDRLVSLTAEPHAIHLGGHSSVVRRRVVLAEGLRFNSEVRPAFEDAEFIGRYLSKFDEPILGLVATAKYYYRKRASKSSLIDTTWTKAEKFTHEPKYGHLGMLRSITNDLGYTPEWAQNMVLYSLYWYFRADRQIKQPFEGIDTRLFEKFWLALQEIFEYIDGDVLRRFSIMNYGWGLTEGILRNFKNESFVKNPSWTVYRWGSVDLHQKTRKFGYSYYGRRPVEKIFINDRQIEPLYSKSIIHNSFNKLLMSERVLVLPLHGAVRIELDGADAEISDPPPAPKRPAFLGDAPRHLRLAPGVYSPAAAELVRKYRNGTGFKLSRIPHGFHAFISKANEESWVTSKPRVISTCKIIARVAKRKFSMLPEVLKQRQDERLVERSRSAHLQNEFHDSWIIMDHPNRADDNGEHFYRFLKLNHPEINAWFVLKESSHDWDRLKAEGFRLLPYGGAASVPAVLNAKFIVSSHIDAGIYDPVDRARFGPSPARRVFLQHGMVMNDLSAWLNTKGLALMISSGIQEHADFVDESRYKFTRKEVSLTGLPRHDSLIDLAKQKAKAPKTLLLIAPTWRQELSVELRNLHSDEHRRKFLTESSFFKAWRQVVQSEVILRIAEEENLSVVFMLHDHLAKYSEIFSFDGAVRVMSYSEVRVQELLTDTKILITDYSSIATEAAIINIPVVYYQFDTDEIFSGKHTFKEGWFNYRRNGFGPVVDNFFDLEFMVQRIRSAGWNCNPAFRERVASTLPYLDGTACQRVFDEITLLDASHTEREARRKESAG